MRNAFDDPYATSQALRQAERMRREFGDLLSVRQQAIRDIIGGQASARWNDLAENALKMSELGGIDRITGAGATKKLLDDLQGAARISGTEATKKMLDDLQGVARISGAEATKKLLDDLQGVARISGVEATKKMLDDLQGVARISGVEATKKLLDDLQGASRISGTVLGNLYSFHAAAEAANASIAKILIDTREGIKFSQLEGIISKEWMIPRESLLKGFVEAGGLTNFKEHLSSMAGISSIAETFTHGIHGKHIGELLGISEKLSGSLAAGFAGFSRSYKNLFESFENDHERILSLRPSLVRMPTVEYFNGSVLTRSVTADDVDDFDVEAENAESLDYFLAQLDPNLVTILHGARQALTSTNPDRIRHFSASFRELLTHVLHMLAPDEEIRTWSTSPQDFAKGRPTRKARLRYICRDINHEPFEEFVNKDIDALLEFFQLFHKGTHTIAARFTNRQLKALHVRVESAMRFLIEISSDEEQT